MTVFIAIVALLAGSSDPVTGKTLLTCLTVSGASICSMSCAAFLEKRKKPTALGFSGIVLSILAAVAILLALEALVIPILMKLRKETPSKGTTLILEHIKGDLYRDADGKEYTVTERMHH